MKSKEQKKAFYAKLRRSPANSKSMKSAWQAIMKECVDDLPYFLSAKSIVDGKAQFVKGLRAGKGQTTSKGKNSSKKKTSMDERTSRKYKRRFKGDSSRSDIMGAWQKRKYNRKK